MAYVPSSDVPSAFLISSDADAVLLDLLGTFILLDGGAEKVLFTKHVRQIDANVISAPTRAALTNAVELNPNKDSVVPLVGNIPTVKSAGADGSVASLLKRIEQNSEGRPLITNTRFNPKFEPIVISKSLRTGRLELIVLAGEPKEVEALQRAVENGDEQTIEKVASNNGTISVLVWFPARPSDPIKRILHTGTAPLVRIITALERAKALPFLHSPMVSAANAYKEVAPPPKTSVRNSASSRPVPVPASKTNSAATKPLVTKRPSAPNSAQPTPARTLTSTTTKTTSTNARPPLARPNAVTSASNRTRPATATTTTKNGLNNNNKVGAARKPVNEAPFQKTTVAPVKGAAMSRASAAVGKVAGNVAAKAASTLPAAPAPVPTPVPAPDEIKEQAPTPVEPSPPLDDSVVILDDVVPDICVDAPQDPASSDLRPPVDLIVIPPTPEPASQSPRSSVDGPPSPTVSPKTDGDIQSEEQQKVLPSDEDRSVAKDLPSPVATDSVPPPYHEIESQDRHELPSPVAPEQDHHEHKESVEPSEPSAPIASDEPAPPNEQADTPEPAAPAAPPVDSPQPTTPSAPPLISGFDDAHIESPEPKSPSPVVEPKHDDGPKPDNEDDSRASSSASPHARDSSCPSPFHVDITPAEPFTKPVYRVPADSSDVEILSDVPEEFKGPHTPQPVGENGLLDDLEEPPKLMKISMDTDDLKKALEKGATAVADQLAQCLDALSLDNTTNSENHEESKLEKPEDPDDVARKISQQMIEEASTPFASALASALTDGVEAAKKLAGEAYDDLADIATTVSEAVTDGVKEASDQVQEKMKAMQTRSSLIEHDGDNRPVKYEETDPVIDSVLETVASDSDRVDHALSNGGPGYENKENGKKPTNESTHSRRITIQSFAAYYLRNNVDDDDGFRVASDTHNVRLFLPPPSARGAKATPVPHLSRPLYFELATVPHFNGRCSLPDEQSAVEYFTNIRSANYILHSDDISPAVLDGWLTGKKHWLRNEHKSRLIPTRHHSALMAFVTAHSAELEEHGMAVNSSLEHNTISLNTEEGREDYHMMKIEL
ncbi:hypothetical protein Q1695_009851 [Nippostrongylus brasiliensis]|nr:hypothetical protein Q1695_009851 [Nippostrongylus brasiliensis]